MGMKAAFLFRTYMSWNWMCRKLFHRSIASSGHPFWRVNDALANRWRKTQP